MSGIINDADAMRKLRNQLKEAAEKLEKQLQKTEGAIEEVAQTWADTKFLEFKNKFGEDKEKIKPLSKKINEYEDEVLRPIEDLLREYLATGQ